MRPKQSLGGRVAIVTGAGRGLGRAHALYMARLGARVVVNDLGVTLGGEREDVTPAETVAREIESAGGEAVSSAHDVSDWRQARDLVDLAVSHFGDLHVLVNNAGVLRDRTIAKLTEHEWDLVIRVHLKGHAAVTHHAMHYWAERARAHGSVAASVINTTSIAGFAGNFGQANYSAAKLGIAALSRVVALEGQKIGVRSNAVSPGGRTRMALSIPGNDDALKRPSNSQDFDPFDPENVSPLIAWLAEAVCPADGQLFHIVGSDLLVVAMPEVAHRLTVSGQWTLDELDRELIPRLLKLRTIHDFL